MEELDENDIEVIEYITQLKISNFIKQNKNMDKKELTKIVEQMIKEKESMYEMDKNQIREILKVKDGI